MKLIKFGIDYKSEINLPRGIISDREIKIGDILYPKGTILKLPDDKARYFVKRVVDWNYFEKTGRLRMIYRPAFILRDLGCYHYKKVCRETRHLRK